MEASVFYEKHKVRQRCLPFRCFGVGSISYLVVFGQVEGGVCSREFATG